MSLLGTYVQGDRISLDHVKPSATLEREADEFAHYAKPLNTGKFESQRLGSWLLLLAAQNGEWRAVPWRLLRNEYMCYGKLKRWTLRNEKCVPKHFESEPVVVVYEAGKGTPPEELLIGVKHMLHHGLAEVVTLEDEDYLIPTNALFKCAPRPHDASTEW